MLLADVYLDLGDVWLLMPVLKFRWKNKLPISFAGCVTIHSILYFPDKLIIIGHTITFTTGR